jgi:endonuclease/exonuclease/phosphatase family metal-dependent hydrolase
MLVRCELPGVGEPFLLSVNHWKSRLHNAGVSSDADRMQTARWLGSKLAARTRETCVVVLGDFNAEPTEPPLRDVGIGAERHFSKVLRWRTPPVRLYNTAWRLMAEPRLWEDTRAGHPAEPRPKTTVSASFSVFDQIMVSAAALRRGPIELVEGSVCCACTAVTSEHNARGILRPRRWEEAAPGSFVGASDHFPLLATFIIR